MAEKLPWFVLTGGPNSGKTTTINLIEEQGYQVIHEGARALLERATNIEQVLEDSCKDPIRIQEALACFNLHHHMGGDKNEIAFVDRGMFDTYAFLKVQKVNPTEFIDYLCKQFTYEGVYLLDMVPFNDGDTHRLETESEARAVHEEFGNVYTDLGYDVVSVPVLEKSVRAEFIINHALDLQKSSYFRL